MAQVPLPLFLNETAIFRFIIKSQNYLFAPQDEILEETLKEILGPRTNLNRRGGGFASEWQYSVSAHCQTSNHNDMQMWSVDTVWRMTKMCVASAWQYSFGAQQSARHCTIMPVIHNFHHPLCCVSLLSIRHWEEVESVRCERHTLWDFAWLSRGSQNALDIIPYPS